MTLSHSKSKIQNLFHRNFWMRLSGTLRSWNDDRGFGFIAPTHGGAEIFVHLTAFPRDGTRPTIGEKLSYELGRGKNRKPQAMKVVRQAMVGTSREDFAREQKADRRPAGRGRLIGLLLLLALVAYGYKQYERSTSLHRRTPESAPIPEMASRQVPVPTDARCDGRTHCSQMTSCAEAKYFLKHCPGTQMDGNHDGIPCERQWCTGLFAK